MNYIVFDLEASCWKFPKDREEQEIIEIGAVKLNAYGEAVDTFQSFVKPVLHPVLSHFCVELTGIDQEMVNRAPTFSKVAYRFEEWLGSEGHYGIAAWGKFDELMLKINCRQHRMEEFWVGDVVNLKKQYADIKGLKNPIGLKKAVTMEGFEFEGDHHRAIDDAKNTAKIFAKYLDDWVFM
nr:exonuclease domain-containing protein [Saprospiraceae bacterium]